MAIIGTVTPAQAQKWERAGIASHPATNEQDLKRKRKVRDLDDIDIDDADIDYDLDIPPELHNDAFEADGEDSPLHDDDDHDHRTMRTYRTKRPRTELRQWTYVEPPLIVLPPQPFNSPITPPHRPDSSPTPTHISPADEDVELPSQFSATTIRGDDEAFTFVFPLHDGLPMADEVPRFPQRQRDSMSTLTDHEGEDQAMHTQAGHRIEIEGQWVRIPGRRTSAVDPMSSSADTNMSVGTEIRAAFNDFKIGGGMDNAHEMEQVKDGRSDTVMAQMGD